MKKIMEYAASYCNWDKAFLLVFSKNVFDPLIYYSHFVPLILAVLVGLIVIHADRRKLSNRALFFMMMSFSAWVVLDSILWGTEKPDIIMFVWSVQILLDLFIYLGAFVLVYSFINTETKRIPLRILLPWAFFFLPILIFLGTHWNLENFDLTNCDREVVEGILWQYTYSVEILVAFFVLLIPIFFLIRGKVEPSLRKQLLLITFGAFSFLILFSFGNIVGSFTEDWSYGQYGLFGMPVFIGFLAYLIVRYQTFNIKLLAVQALVMTLAVLIGAQLFFIKTQINFVLTSITFLLSVVFGILLIRSVKAEIERKEELQLVTDKLAEANVELKRLDRSKTEFISIASHQLRTPLTAIKGFISLLLEGSYGVVPKEIEGILNKVYTANERIIDLVEDLLNISRMESGRLNYEYSEVDMCAFLSELRDTFAITAKKKGLELVFECPESATLSPVWIDRQKSFEVISNLIDNALKYTREGNVRVRAEAVPGAVRVSVIDTGIGISEEAKRYLFSKFTRGEESEKMFANGTGLGLYVGKAMMEAQGGRISVESEGTGKGSTFSVEFPTKRLIGRES